MEKFIWTSDYNLDIEIIDEQHQHFFEIVNKLYDLLEQKKTDRKILILAVEELVNYAFYHLSTEEKYFNQFSYADIGNHMKYHTMFREKANDYAARVKNVDDIVLPDLLLEIADFSKNWLSQHILIADKMYAPLFKEHGLN
jgi:hemerythrin-like metal-binding protein